MLLCAPFFEPAPQQQKATWHWTWWCKSLILGAPEVEAQELCEIQATCETLCQNG